MIKYSLEIKKSNDGSFIRQVDIFNTYEEAEKYIDTFPLNNEMYYSIWCIEYDNRGEEIDSYPIYN